MICRRPISQSCLSEPGNIVFLGHRVINICSNTTLSQRRITKLPNATTQLRTPNSKDEDSNSSTCNAANPHFLHACTLLSPFDFTAILCRSSLRAFGFSRVSTRRVGYVNRKFPCRPLRVYEEDTKMRCKQLTQICTYIPAFTDPNFFSHGGIPATLIG